MRRAVLALPLFLAACAHGPSLQSRMAAYIGAPEDRLVQSMGVPDKQITVNGIQYLAYVHSHAEVIPNGVGMGGFGPWYGPYYGAYAQPFPQDIQVWSCEITFALKDGRVESFTLKGNDCN
jgi:hypothetical protein